MEIANTRRRLLLGSALAVSSLFAYGRGAYAACVVTVAPSYDCSGANAVTQSILNVTDADVSTLPGFSVNAPAGNGIEISGDGEISFIDYNNSGITGQNNGLQISGLDGAGVDNVFVDVNGSVPGGNNGSVTGGNNGIAASNSSDGGLAIIAGGKITGTALDGIFAGNSPIGSGIFVTTGTGSSVTGGLSGIFAINFGSGKVQVLANGDVTGATAGGIHAVNDNGTDLAIITGSGTVVTGAGTGINGFNKGSGSLSILANGDVTGIGDDAISARNMNGTDLFVTTGAGSTVQGGISGIVAHNYGSGELEITADGDVTGTSEHGILASTDTFGTNLKVSIGTGGAVSGGFWGVAADHHGSGALEIDVNGQVTGVNDSGIYAINDLAGTALTITTGVGSAVLGGINGIKAINMGAGALEITVGGLVSTTGLIPSDYAIFAFGSSATIDGLNTSNIVGRVTTGGGDDLFANAGVWETNGLSDFGAGTNAITNSGSVHTSFNGGTAESATFGNTGTFTNSGTISLSDETGGNGSQIHDQLTIDGDFVGGGILQLDAYLGGAGSTADLLVITGNVSGVTQLQVLNTSTGGGAANLDGIALVQVNGTSAAGDFVLANGPISAGLFTYDLQFDVANSVHELVSSGAATASAELATFASAAQSIWYDTLGVVDERFDELHSGIRTATMIDGGTLVQPASDTPGAQPGLWGKLIGRTTDRNTSSSVGSVATDISYGLDTTGLVFGVDGAIDSFILGATGGYINANQDFDSGSAASYEGFMGGLYATYVIGNFHLNGQLRANVLDLDYTMAGTPGTSDAGMVTLGAAVEAGYRMDITDRFYAEPVAQLAYADSSTHNGDALGTAFTAEGESLRGAIGLNLGGQIIGSGIIVRPELTLKAWGEFEGNNSAAFSAFVVADNMPDTFGEAGLSIEAVSLANGWSGNLKGNAQFAKDFTSFGGHVGLRKNF